MINPGSIKITNLKAPGRYIAVKQLFRSIHVVYVPDEQNSKITTNVVLLTLDEDLYIKETTDLTFPKLSDIYIGKIYDNGKGDFIIQGHVTLSDPKPGQFKNSEFKIRNYTEYDFRESRKNSVGIVYGISIPDVNITAVSKKREILHTIGHRIKTGEEVYIQYNTVTNLVVQELAFYTELGETTLKEIHCNEQDEVFLVGHIETDEGVMGYFGKVTLNTYNPSQV